MSLDYSRLNVHHAKDYNLMDILKDSNEFKSGSDKIEFIQTWGNIISVDYAGDNFFNHYGELVLELTASDSNLATFKYRLVYSSKVFGGKNIWCFN